MLEHTFRFGNIVFPKGEKVAEKVLHKFWCWFCWDPDGAFWKSVLIKANFMVFDRSDMNRSLYAGYLFHPRRDGSQVNWRNLSSIVKIMKNNLWPKSSVTDFYIFLICPAISQKQRCSVYYYIKKLKDWSFVPQKKLQKFFSVGQLVSLLSNFFQSKHKYFSHLKLKSWKSL